MKHMEHRHAAIGQTSNHFTLDLSAEKSAIAQFTFLNDGFTNSYIARRNHAGLWATVAFHYEPSWAPESSKATRMAGR